MRKIWDFHGGIHPPENKEQSTACAIETAPLPARLIIPLQQSIGAAATPIVNVGDSVLKGQLIAEADGFVSAPVHASSSGVVTAIEERSIPHPSGLTGLCVEIETDGKDEWVDLSNDRLVEADAEPQDLLAISRELPRETILDSIRQAGIIGLGGAGFPTAIKLNPSEDSLIHTVILNAAECEPYITADDMLMREQAEEILQGLAIIDHLLKPEQVLVGIEDNKPHAIAALHIAVRQLGLEERIALVTVPTKYPSGGEKQLIQLLTGEEVPNGGIPADIGIVCHNVGTAVAIHRAVHFGEPLISRITTVTGEAVTEQKNLDVLIGTPMSHLLEHCGLDNNKLARLVMGGPMMGFTVDDMHSPVIKTTNCLLAGSPEELPNAGPEQNCIRCGICAEVCPASLLPQQLYWFSRAKEFDKAMDHNLIDCIECGACSYVCPSNIPLVQYYRFAKGEVRKLDHEHSKSEHARIRFEARQARLDREQAEKEAKRKARAKAAAEQQAKKAAQAEAEAASDSDTSASKPADDDKAAVIQAALARAEAKKRAREEQAEQSPDNQTDNKEENP